MRRSIAFCKSFTRLGPDVRAAQGRLHARASASQTTRPWSPASGSGMAMLRSSAANRSMFCREASREGPKMMGTQSLAGTVSGLDGPGGTVARRCPGRFGHTIRCGQGWRNLRELHGALAGFVTRSRGWGLLIVVPTCCGSGFFPAPWEAKWLTRPVRLSECSSAHSATRPGRIRDRWRIHLTDDDPPSPIVYCEDCAERELD